MEFSGIRKLFGNTELPTVVSDSSYVLTRFSGSGFCVLHMDEVTSKKIIPPTKILLIPALPSVHPNENLLEALKQSAVLVVPLLAFSSGNKDVDYLLDRLSSLCFESTTKKNLELTEFIQYLDTPIIVESSKCKLMVELGDDVDIMVPKVEANIAIGQWVSIIQYLELGLVPNANNNSFKVNGTLSCDGVTIAHHLHSHFTAGPLALQAWQVFEELRANNQFPLILEIEQSILKSILTNDGIEVLHRILPLTDEIMRGSLTEVAFAALSASGDTDWSINSQLNEPAGGFHIGIGAGEQAAHIDFVSPNAIYQ
ncbi:hypothetical protein [Acinetobacter sp. ANC 4173]|uniref:hypothetical protein n=1 Tax=Acinetobacter sp. ANC 4173 TaxID=2529837 RepID=UPI0010391161|nr:hypothetical protein [Acinetobacter sp. ANC 4173]TCB77252.1 hypothetical protein E0H94_15445 [Acinetobacter sp. ANC 4173]